MVQTHISTIYFHGFGVLSPISQNLLPLKILMAQLLELALQSLRQPEMEADMCRNLLGTTENLTVCISLIHYGFWEPPSLPCLSDLPVWFS